MDEKNIQQQINELDHKVNLILDYVNQQRLKSERTDDLIDDLSIVGKDVYDTAVTELENQGVEIDLADLRILSVKLLKNTKNFNTILNALESVMDFLKDASPIANEMIIDFTKKLHEFDKKGYFEFFGEATKILDNIVTNFSKEDVKQLADNIVLILQTVKNLTQPEMLNLVNNTVKVYGSLEMDDVPQYSIWKLMREMGKPEMKKAMGFMVTFIKNIANNTESNINTKK